MGKNALGAIDDDVDDTTDDTTTTDAASGDADDTTDDTTTTDDVDDEVDADDAEAEFLAGLTPAQVTYFQGERAKLAKANTNARTHRLARRALEKAGTGPKPTPPPAKTTTTGTPPVLDAAALLAQVRAEFAAESKVTTVKASAERELLAAGLVLPSDKAKHGSAVSRAVKLLGDLADLDPDDVVDEVAELRREMPSLFTTKRRRPAGGAGGPSRTDSGNGAKPDTVAGLFDG